MGLFDIINEVGGSAAIEQIGARVGLTPAQTRNAAAALLPALSSGIKRQSANPSLGDLLGQGLAPGAAPTEETTSKGNQILGQIFGSKDISRSVATNAAASTGIGADQLKALLPLLASLGAGALASKSGGNQAAPGGASSVLGMLDQDGDGDPLNDIMGMAGKFLRQ
jgi:hypothetical protein